MATSDQQDLVKLVTMNIIMIILLLRHKVNAYKFSDAQGSLLPTLTTDIVHASKLQSFFYHKKCSKTIVTIESGEVELGM